MPFGAHHVGLTGGEPYLHPNFPQIVEAIVNYGYTWNVVSYGQQMEPYLSLMEKFRANFTSVNLSFDGATAEVRDENRGKDGAFVQASASAWLYVQHGFPLKIKTSLNQRNKGQIEKTDSTCGGIGRERDCLWWHHSCRMESTSFVER